MTPIEISSLASLNARLSSLTVLGLNAFLLSGRLIVICTATMKEKGIDYNLMSIHCRRLIAHQGRARGSMEKPWRFLRRRLSRRWCRRIPGPTHRLRSSIRLDGRGLGRGCGDKRRSRRRPHRAERRHGTALSEHSREEGTGGWRPQRPFSRRRPCSRPTYAPTEEVVGVASSKAKLSLVRDDGVLHGAPWEGRIRRQLLTCCFVGLGWLDKVGLSICKWITSQTGWWGSCNSCVSDSGREDEDRGIVQLVVKVLLDFGLAIVCCRLGFIRKPESTWLCLTLIQAWSRPELNSPFALSAASPLSPPPLLCSFLSW